MTAVLFVAISSAAYQFYLPVTGAGPDEPGHYAVVKFIAEEGRLPSVEQTGFQAKVITYSVNDQGQARELSYPYVSYASMPPGPYVLSALFTKIPSDTDHSDIRQARIPQALWAALTVLFLFLAAGAAFPTRASEIGVMAVILASFWPRLAFTAGYVNNDAMMVAATTGILWRWWEGYRNGWRTSDAVWLGMMLSAALLAKPNGYIVVVMSLAVAFICARRPLVAYFARVLLALCVAVIPLVPWLWVAARRYGIDIFGSQAVSAQVAELSVSDLSAASRDIHYFVFLKDYWADPTFRTFLSAELLPAWVSVVAVSIAALGFTGIALAIARAMQAPKALIRSREAWLHATCILALPILIVVASVNSYLNDSYFGMQGRYLFPAFSFIILYLSAGIVHLARDKFGVKCLTAFVAIGMGALGWFALINQHAETKELLLPDGALAVAPWIRHSWQIGVGVFAIVIAQYLARSSDTGTSDTTYINA